MNLRLQLSQRLHQKEIQEIIRCLQHDTGLTEELYRMIYDEDERVSYQALWVCNHLPAFAMKTLQDKRDELTDEMLSCHHSGKRRLLLNLLYRYHSNNTPRVDLLNFCLERMMSSKEQDGTRSVCIKLAHRLTDALPELQQELRLLLEIMEPEELSPAVRSSRAGVLKKMSSF